MKIHKKRRRISGVARQVRQLPKGTEVAGYTATANVLIKSASDRSNVIEDAFADMYSGASGLGVSEYNPLEPQYDVLELSQCVGISNILRQCIEAMVTNTTSYGYSLEYVGPEGKERSAQSVAEKARFQGLIDNPSPGETNRSVWEKCVADKETIGFRAIEVLRDSDGQVCGYAHIPAVTLRKTRHDRTATTYLRKVYNSELRKYEDTPSVQRFRRYIQRVGGDTIFFKEFGDPRDIDSRNGIPVGDRGTLPDAMDNLATEVIWDEFYSAGHVYGTPRWIGVMPSILGSRESELVNLNFFRENAIPAMAVLVSGGALTDESFQNLSQYITAIRGSDAMQRVMILEASADDVGSTNHSAPAPKVEMKPMISERQQDGLFKDYDDHNIVKVRSSFRLPPILVGKAEDYTRASALASVRTAENQVFAPERAAIDDLMNSTLRSSLEIVNWRYRSLGPSTTDAEELSSVVEALGNQGALTPNVVIKLANKIIGVYIEPINDAWGDYPFQVIEQVIKNGGTIKGMTEFIDELGAATQLNPIRSDRLPADNPAPEPADPTAEPKKPAKKSALPNKQRKLAARTLRVIKLRSAVSGLVNKAA